MVRQNALNLLLAGWGMISAGGSVALLLHAGSRVTGVFLCCGCVCCAAALLPVWEAGKGKARKGLNGRCAKARHACAGMSALSLLGAVVACMMEPGLPALVPSVPILLSLHVMNSLLLLWLRLHPVMCSVNATRAGLAALLCVGCLALLAATRGAVVAGVFAASSCSAVALIPTLRLILEKMVDAATSMPLVHSVQGGTEAPPTPQASSQPFFRWSKQVHPAKLALGPPRPLLRSKSASVKPTVNRREGALAIGSSGKGSSDGSSLDADTRRWLSSELTNESLSTRQASFQPLKKRISTMDMGSFVAATGVLATADSLWLPPTKAGHVSPSPLADESADKQIAAYQVGVESVTTSPVSSARSSACSQLSRKGPHEGWARHSSAASLHSSHSFHLGASHAVRGRPRQGLFKIKSQPGGLSVKYPRALRGEEDLLDFLLPSSSPSWLPRQGQVEKEDFARTLGCVADWNFNVFRFASHCNAQPLLGVMRYSMAALNVLELLHVPSSTFYAWVQEVEANYCRVPDKPNPYHNAFHAADVVQATLMFLVSPKVSPVITEVEALSLILAACMHDFRHPGVSNAFLITQQHELALRYNDLSVLENFHAAEAFASMRREPHRLLSKMPPESARVLRASMVSCILATDLARSKHYLDNLARELPLPSGVAPTADQRLAIMQVALKCADVCHAARTPAVHRRWSALVSEEFHRQGDLERAAGMPISPLCDRKNFDLPNSQMGFIEFVVRPCFSIWTAFCGPGPWVESLQANERFWADSQGAGSRAITHSLPHVADAQHSPIPSEDDSDEAEDVITVLHARELDVALTSAGSSAGQVPAACVSLAGSASSDAKNDLDV